MSAWVSGLFARLLMLAPYRDIFGDESGVGQHGLKFDPYFVLQPDKPITDVSRYMPRIFVFSENGERELRFIETLPRNLLMKAFSKSGRTSGPALHNQTKGLPRCGLGPLRVFKAKVLLKCAPAEGFSGSVPSDSPFSLIGHANLRIVFEHVSSVRFRGVTQVFDCELPRKPFDEGLIRSRSVRFTGQTSLAVFLLRRWDYRLTDRILPIILGLHSDVFFRVGWNLELLDFFVIHIFANRRSHKGDTINISDDQRCQTEKLNKRLEAVPKGTANLQNA